MKNHKRVFTIVMDSLGVGALPDAVDYGDEGTDTLGDISKSVKHFHMMGLHITKPFRTFTENGFPKELLEELSKRTGRVIIGNKSASGTEILNELAKEEIAMGHMIVYTSADSVLQIYGNEETFGLDELYRCCEIAREITRKDE